MGDWVAARNVKGLFEGTAPPAPGAPPKPTQTAASLGDRGVGVSITSPQTSAPRTPKLPRAGSPATQSAPRSAVDTRASVTSMVPASEAWSSATAAEASYST